MHSLSTMGKWEEEQPAPPHSSYWHCWASSRTRRCCKRKGSDTP
ncbi:hypothetical protein QF048_000046 [Streptomyces sp. W4I9-2]|nr:hypothetical protein [Streptomyces sp. W4I9-2]